MAYDQTRTLGELGQNTTVSTGGIVAAVNAPAQFDNTLNYATTAFVKQALGNYPSATNLPTSSTTTLTASQSGAFLIFAGGNINLPAASTMTIGCGFTICVALGGTITTNGTDTLFFAGTGTNTSPLTVGVGDYFTLVAVNSTAWELLGTPSFKTAPGFAVSTSSAGYQKLPSGLIIQWSNQNPSGATGTTTYSGTWTYPVAFPSGTIMPLVCLQNQSGGSAPTYAVQIWANSSSASGMTYQLDASAAMGAMGVSLFAIGH
jgi:hypothetical protein